MPPRISRRGMATAPVRIGRRYFGIQTTWKAVWNTPFAVACTFSTGTVYHTRALSQGRAPPPRTEVRGFRRGHRSMNREGGERTGGGPQPRRHGRVSFRTSWVGDQHQAGRPRLSRSVLSSTFEGCAWGDAEAPVRRWHDGGPGLMVSGGHANPPPWDPTLGEG